MSNENAVSINYKMEYERVSELNGELRCEINQLEALNKSYERELNEKDNKIAFLEGQVNAFKFCVAGGKNNAK